MSTDLKSSNAMSGILWVFSNYKSVMLTTGVEIIDMVESTITCMSGIWIYIEQFYNVGGYVTNCGIIEIKSLFNV